MKDLLQGALVGIACGILGSLAGISLATIASHHAAPCPATYRPTTPQETEA